MNTELYRLEGLFWTALRGRVAPEAVDRAFVGRGALDARARLGIYARMHVARQVNALRDAYPKLALWLGERFEHLAREYLRAHPSCEPAIERVGARLSAFVNEPAVSALARLEWARHAALLAPDPIELLARSELDPERFAEGRLDFVRAHEIVQIFADTLAIWHDPLADLAPSHQASVQVAVWRAGASVFHRQLDADEARALAAAVRGAPLAEVCAEFSNAPEAAQRAALVLRRWFECCWIERVHYPAEVFAR
jgi:uncharacterized protein